MQDLMSREVHGCPPRPCSRKFFASWFVTVARHPGRRGQRGGVGNGTDLEVLQHFLPQVLGQENATDPAPLSDVEVGRDATKYHVPV